MPGIGQTVDVVKSNAIYGSSANQLQKLGVDIVEDSHVLDADADEIGNLEETPVGQGLAGCPPMREPPHLKLVQGMNGCDVTHGLLDRALEYLIIGFSGRAQLGLEVGCGLW